MELGFGPRVRLSPFLSRAISSGIEVASVYNHMVMPVATSDPEADYEALTERVAIWDVGCQRQVQVQGPDAIEFCCYLSARNLSDLEIGTAKYAPLCDYQGYLINDPIALRVAPDTVWLSIADSDIGLWVRAIAGESGANVNVSEPDVSPLAIQGPKAEDTVADALGTWVRDLKLFQFKRTVYKGIPLVVCRSGWSKHGGFELFLEDGSKGNELWDLLWESGEEYGIRVGAPNNRERIENFLLSHRSDTGNYLDPFESGIGQFVDLDCPHEFIGKSALVTKSGLPKLRELKGLYIDGDEMGPNHQPLRIETLEGDFAGQIRVLNYSPKFRQNIGLAIIESPHNVSGVSLKFQSENGLRNATVSDLPFI